MKKLVDLMNGTIKINSEIGNGTTVIIRIPMKIASHDDTLPKYSTIHTKNKTLLNKHILLTEDNDLNAEIAITMLESEGIKVDRANDGIQCIDKIKKHSANYYALILMDIQMPVLNGYETTRNIRNLPDKIKANIPIIAMTANAFSEDRSKSIESGMNDHISKPIDINILLNTISKYI